MTVMYPIKKAKYRLKVSTIPYMQYEKSIEW